MPREPAHGNWAATARQDRLTPEDPHGLTSLTLIFSHANPYGTFKRAVVVLDTGQDLTLEGVRSFCEAKISRFKWPKEVIFTEELPQAGGQVDREAVTRRF